VVVWGMVVWGVVVWGVVVWGVVVWGVVVWGVVVWGRRRDLQGKSTIKPYTSWPQSVFFPMFRGGIFKLHSIIYIVYWN